MQYVYILASSRNGTLYIGTTRNLESRMIFHKEKRNNGCFTSKYGVNRLVYYEEYETVMEAVRREKSLKKWKRAWKVKLIEQRNPQWRDLAADW